MAEGYLQTLFNLLQEVKVKRQRFHIDYGICPNMVFMPMNYKPQVGVCEDILGLIVEYYNDKEIRVGLVGMHQMEKTKTNESRKN